MGHSCRTLLWDTLVRHSCRTLLWVTCRTLLWDTLTRHSCRTLLRDTLVGHSCGTLLWDTLVGHSCRTLLWDTLVGHSCGTLLWDTLIGHSCGILLSDTLKGHSCETLLSDTVAGHSCGTLLWDTLPAPQILRILKLYYKVTSSHLPAPQILRGLKLHYKVASARLHVARSTRTISAECCAGSGQIALSPAFRALDTHDLRRGLRGRRTNRTLACISRTRHARSPQRVARAWDKSALSPAFRALDTHDLCRGLRAHGTNRTLACISHTRHARSPQRVASQVSKTSVSYETSSKTHTSKSVKRAFRTRLPPKVKRKHPSEHTHHAALPSSFAIPAPPNNIRSHANPNVTATFTSTTTHNLTIPCACHESFRVRVHTCNAHRVLRLPRNVTSVTPRNLTFPCACHENRTSTLQSPHEVLRLPRKVTISSHVSFNKICTTPHVWNDFDPFRAHSHPSKSPFQLRLVTKTELRCHALKRKSQWHGHIQHPKNTTLQTLIPMALRRNLRISQNAAPVQRNASRFLRDMSCSCKSQWISGAN